MCVQLCASVCVCISLYDMYISPNLLFKWLVKTLIVVCTVYFSRGQILKACREAEEKFIMVTHGTDTILQTAAFLAEHLRVNRETESSPDDQASTLVDETSQSAKPQCSPTDQSRSTFDTEVRQAANELRQMSFGSGESSVWQNIDKTVVLTGAFLPERFKETDADFNVGVVVGAMQGGLTPGVYVSLGGRVWPWDKVTRSDSGQYVSLQKH